MKKKAIRKKNWSKCAELDSYIYAIKSGRIRSSKEIKAQYKIIEKEFDKKNIYVDLDLYAKYIKIGELFFKEIFLYEKAATALALCTFYKGTKKPRWNKCFMLEGRGNGKDGMIAWWSVCLTSKYHGIEKYDIDIIANSMEQSLRPVNDIVYMVKDKKKQNLLKKTGDAILSTATTSYITARSSDAGVQDGLRSGAIIFNEVHAYQSYAKLNVMKTGLGKVDDPRTFYFTTNGEIRGGVLDDMLDTATDVLNGVSDDSRTLYLIYKLDDKKEVADEKNWVKANPSIKYRESFLDEIRDEYLEWKKNPDILPAFMQKRMNLPEMPTTQEVVPWEVILETNQEYEWKRLEGKPCVLGIDVSRTTDWFGANLLFYDEELDKYPCINHAFVCGRSRDLPGIKAPYLEWAKDGLLSIIDKKEIDPSVVLDYMFDLAADNKYNIISVVIDDFRKSVLINSLEERGFSKSLNNLTMIRPSNIAQILPVVERVFLNERFIWGDNPCLRWATNNTKVIPWKKSTTGDNDMGNQLYAKINQRFRKTDPFMALVHSMVKADELAGESSINLLNRGF